MITILVIYHTQSGHTEKMARAVAEGVVKAEPSRVVCKRACEATVTDLLSCDALVVGSPEYFGYMSGAVKDFFDRTFYAAEGKIFKKPYAVFISAGNDGSGALLSIERIARGLQLQKVHEPVIAKGAVDEAILDRCRELGETLARGCELGIY